MSVSPGGPGRRPPGLAILSLGRLEKQVGILSPSFFHHKRTKYDFTVIFLTLKSLGEAKRTKIEPMFSYSPVTVRL
jgi:hypothetical protein